jgi:hypothetical protein
MLAEPFADERKAALRLERVSRVDERLMEPVDPVA